MRFLLDTHAFLLWIGDDPGLSQNARKILSSGENEPLLSVASAWEMAIKIGTGKLSVNDELEAYLHRHLSENEIQILETTLRHTATVATLPHYHRDPFDRMLVAQALVEEMPILTADPRTSEYPAEVIW